MNQIGKKLRKVRAALVANTKVRAAWDAFATAYRQKRGTTYGMTLDEYVRDFIRTAKRFGQPVLKTMTPSYTVKLWAKLDKSVAKEAEAYLRGEGFKNAGIDCHGLTIWKEVA